MIKRKMIAVITLTAIFAGTITGCGMIKKDPEAIAKSVVATVDGQEITRAQFDLSFEPIKVSFEQNYGPDIWTVENEGKTFLELAQEDTVDMMISDILLLKKAEEMKLAVTDEEATAEVDRFKGFYDTEEEFNKLLEGQKMTPEYFKEYLKNELTKSKLYDEITKDVVIDDAAVVEYYTTHQDEFVNVQASHILVATKEEADKVMERIKAGEDFAALAKELSTDPGSKDAGGDLGYFSKGKMVPEFETAAFATPVGEISDIVKSDHGFHIIKVVDKKTDKIEDVTEELKAKLLSDEQTKVYQTLIDDLKKDAKIEKKLKNLK